jgi:hypothetical protein
VTGCVFTPRTGSCTDDGNQCTNDVCAGGLCTHPNRADGVACEDGAFCTVNDTCQGGTCSPGPARTCDDNDPCTSNVCDESGHACVNDPIVPCVTTTTATTSTTTTSTTSAVTTTTATTSTTLAAFGHLKCYQAKDLRTKATYTLDAIPNVAGFANELGCTVKVGAKRICVEVGKQNVSPPPPGGGPPLPPNTGAVFLSYKLKCPKPTVAPVAFHDQFGAGSFTIGTVNGLLVPALPGPANNHFVCYKARDPRPRASYTMNLIAGVAGFTNELGCAVKLGAKGVCVQAAKQNVAPPPPGGGPGPGPSSGAKLVSYKLKCPKGILPPASIADQFGAGSVTPKAAKILLVPAS